MKDKERQGKQDNSTPSDYITGDDDGIIHGLKMEDLLWISPRNYNTGDGERKTRLNTVQNGYGKILHVTRTGLRTLRG
jgi:hypothetical protein